MSGFRSLAFSPTPEQMARLADQAEAGRQMAAHAAAFLDARGPELSRRLTPDPRLEETILSIPPRSIVSEAADLLDRLSAAVEPADRDASDASLAHAILARCEVLAARAKKRLQS